MENILQDISVERLLLLLNFILVLLLFFINFATRSKLKKLKTKYTKFMNGLSEKNIEEVLEDCIDKTNKIGEKNLEIENHINRIERDLLQCIQKVGIIRFNAFDNVGSDLSFSIALLDSSDSGVVISGIYARDSSSTYAKPVASGKSKYALSAEEIQSIDIARKVNRERPYNEK